MTIRLAKEIDTMAIANIWIEGIMQQHQDSKAYEKVHIEDVSAHLSRQIRNQDDNFKFWVAEDETGEIVGWQSIMPFHPTPNPMIRNSVGMSSTYVKAAYQTSGIGKRLLQHALDYCKETTICYVLWVVLQENHKSLKMCERIGFIHLGNLPMIQDLFESRYLIMYKTK